MQRLADGLRGLFEAFDFGGQGGGRGLRLNLAFRQFGDGYAGFLCGLPCFVQCDILLFEFGFAAGGGLARRIKLLPGLRNRSRRCARLLCGITVRLAQWLEFCGGLAGR